MWGNIPPLVWRVKGKKNVQAIAEAFFDNQKRMKTNDTLDLAEVLFVAAFGHNPKADVQDLVTGSLEAAIAYDERIALLKDVGLASVKAKVNETASEEAPAPKAVRAKEKRARK
jgi:hypothetical protein